VKPIKFSPFVFCDDLVVPLPVPDPDCASDLTAVAQALLQASLQALLLRLFNRFSVFKTPELAVSK
jgi:hypothetical protein